MFCQSCGKEIPEQSAFCPSCGKAIGTGAQEHLSQGPAKAFLIILFGIVAVLILVWFVERDLDIERADAGHAGGPAYVLGTAAPVYISKTDKLATGDIRVNAGAISPIRFTVDAASMKDVRIVGHFVASGGSRNDIQVVVAGEEAYQNWSNGHSALVLYGTDKITVGDINVPIPMSGTYYLAFSNKFSALTSKTVAADVELRYQVLQASASGPAGQPAANVNSAAK